MFKNCDKFSAFRPFANLVHNILGKYKQIDICYWNYFRGSLEPYLYGWNLIKYGSMHQRKDNATQSWK